MPNHIQNRLQILGEQSEVKRVFDHIASPPDAQIDFNKIKEMPNSIHQEIHSGIETAVKVTLKMGYSDNQLLRLMEMENRSSSKSPLSFNDEEWEQFIICLNNVRKYGYIYWLDWSLDNWGTKWNAYSQNDKRNTDDTIYFQTAWSAPVDLILELSRQFPKVVIKLDYADEDAGNNTGKMEMKAGVLIKEHKPEGGSNEAYELYLELNPDCDYIKKVNGQYGYIDED